MSQPPKVIVPPAYEPVDFTDLQNLFLRVTSSDEYLLIEDFLKAARQHLERRTGRAFIEQTLEIALNQWPCCEDPDYPFIVLPRATPLVSVVSVTYRDSDGNITTMPTVDYVVDVDSMPGRIVPPYNGQWPSGSLYPGSPIKIQYVAGFVDTSPATGFPDSDVKAAIRLMVGHLYEHREAVIVADKNSVDTKALAMGIDHLLANFDIPGF